MSFSGDVKKQLAENLPSEHCCKRAELLALVKTAGTLDIRGKDGISLVVVTESPSVAKSVVKLSRDLFDIPGNLSVYRKGDLKKNNRYEIRIPYQERVKRVLYYLGFIDETGEWLDFSGGKLNPDITERECCKRAYLAGAFMGSGSVNDPGKSYHLEITAGIKEHAVFLREVLAELGISSGICLRKNRYVVYVKNADLIGEFLLQTGAHQAYLSMESSRTTRDIRNKLNRRENCELANIDRAVDSAILQKQAILKIAAKVGLDSLSPGLKQAAELRLANTEASIGELAAMADPPVGKSGMNHRLNKLKEIAKNL